MVKMKTMVCAFVWIATAFFLGIANAIAFEVPPSVKRDPILQSKLEASFKDKGRDYSPRTHLMVGDKPKYINRLIKEVSPYLLQHAHNPVDWFPWSASVMQRALQENKLIFLSIGYATCHWCHVMERESFDQEDVGKILNENFISIKIDREEFPDLDRLYLTATQLQQGQGGWPNTLWLTPDGKPFHTGTYFTKEELIRTSQILAEGWRSPTARPEILQVANGLSSQVMEIVGGGQEKSVPLNDLLYSRASDTILKKHNDFEGGFSEETQFPHETYLLYLIDEWRRGGQGELLDVVTLTLDAISAGGIHDHVGGGFHRYAVDPGWNTPHFEKMLYNQAQLSRVFLEAWEATGKQHYARAAKRALSYVMRDMTSGNGAFYSAEDAESLNSEGKTEEGAFYTWRIEELDDFVVADTDGRDTLFGLTNPTENAPSALRMNIEDLSDFKFLDLQLEKLRKVRMARNRPLKDTKIIAGWNGLIIRSLAASGVAFQDKAYITAAEKAAISVWETMWNSSELSRISVQKVSSGDGLLEDYVWLALGFVAVSDATNDDFWLNRATLLMDTAWKKFSTENGRLKQSSKDAPFGTVFGAIDEAVPSAESSTLELLGMLLQRTGELKYYSWSERLANGLSTVIARKPENMTYALMANRVRIDGESTVRQVRGNGAVNIQLTPNILKLDIKEGWHLSANEPGYDYLVGTTINGADAKWPEGFRTKLGFATQEAFVYKGKLEIPIDNVEGQVSMTIQACSDQICLAPEKAIFRKVKK